MYYSTLSLTSALDGCGWSTPRPGRFSAGKDPLPIVSEDGWFPGPDWTGEENLVPTGIRYPDRRVRSESPTELFRPTPCNGQVIFHRTSIKHVCSGMLCIYLRTVT